MFQWEKNVESEEPSCNMINSTTCPIHPECTLFLHNSINIWLLNTNFPILIGKKHWKPRQETDCKILWHVRNMLCSK